MHTTTKRRCTTAAGPMPRHASPRRASLLASLLGALLALTGLQPHAAPAPEPTPATGAPLGYATANPPAGLWSYTGGPIPTSLYTVHSLAIDPVDPANVYAGTSSGGVYKTEDHGTTWKRLGINTSRAVYAVVTHPAMPDTVYASTYFTLGPPLYKSTDGGQTWTGLSAAPVGIRTLAIAPASPHAMYAGTSTAVYKSTDGGATWTSISVGSTPRSVRAIVIDPSAPDTLYVGTTNAGVYTTTTGGPPWTQVTTGLTSLDVRSLALDPTAPATLFAGTAGGVFKTTTGGAGWARVGEGQTAGAIASIAIDPDTPTRVYAGGTQFYTSTDGGTNWAATAGLPTGTPQSIAIDPQSPQTIYSGPSGRGLWKTTDAGGAWTESNTGLTYAEAWSLALDPHTTTKLFAAANNKIYAFDTDTRAWEMRSNGFVLGQVWQFAFDPTTPGTIYAATFCSSSGGVSKSTDGGATWTLANTGLTVLCGEGIVLDPASPTTIYASTNDGIFKSVDAAGTWAPTDIPADAGTRKDYQAIAIDPLTPATLYAGGTLPNHVYKTTDGAQTWVATGAIPTVNEAYVNAVVVDPDTPSTVYLAADNVYKTVDGGDHWTDTGLAGTEIRSLVLVPGTPPTLFASAWYTPEVYRSRDGGTTWTLFGSGLPNVGVVALAYDPTNDVLYAGTAGEGVWAAPAATEVLSVTGITPTWGSTGGGTEVTITGTGFQQGATVTIGGSAATDVVVVSNTTISARTAPHALGTVDTVVTNPDNETGTLAGAFTYVDPTDLQVTGVTGLPPVAGPGTVFIATDTTRNNGPGPAPASWTGVFLSANNVLDPADVQVGQRAVPELAAGATSSGAISVTIPGTVTPAVYYLLTAADAPGDVAETNETNNVYGRTVKVMTNLLVPGLVAPAGGTPGAPVDVTDTTKCAGPGGAPPSTTGFYLSVDNVWDVGDRLLGTRPVPALASGKTSVATTAVAIPADVAPGAYFLVAVADSPALVPESKETDNRRTRPIKIGPDLQLAVLTAPASAARGATITIGDTTKNIGLSAAPASLTRFYLSTDALPDAGDVVLGERIVGPLPVPGSSAGTTAVVIPPGTPARSYYILAMADGDGEVAELSESNNRKTKAIRVK